MKNFEIYSNYYDLLNSKKNYLNEVNYIDKLIRSYDRQAKSILDLGCGTAKHLNYLHKKKYKLHGVDISKHMIEIAKKRLKNKDICLTVSDVTKLKLNAKFDVVTSLFHVMSYQDTNNKVLNFFDSAYNHLNDNGIFIFDFWYGPGVLTDLPTVRIKRMENSKLKCTRISEPSLFPQLNCVDVNFEIHIKEKNKSNTLIDKEKHRMRYFFDNEIKLFGQLKGFKVINIYEWLTLKNPTFKSWNSIAILKKIKND